MGYQMAKDKTKPAKQAKPADETESAETGSAETGSAPTSAEASAGKETGAETVTAAAVARLLKVNVRVPALDDAGRPIMDKGVYRVVERKLIAEHIIAVKRRGKRIVCVTVDGQKLDVAAA